MTAQEIANRVHSMGFNVVKNQNGYETATYGVYDSEFKVIYSCKGTKGLKNWYKENEFEYLYKVLKERYELTVPTYTLDGFKQ